MTFNRSLWPKTLAARIVLLLVIGLGLSHAISLSVYDVDRGEIVNLIGRAQMIERIGTITSLVANTPPQYQKKIIDLANSSILRIALDKSSNVKNNDLEKAKFFSNALIEQIGVDEKMPVLTETIYGEESIWRHLTGKSIVTHISAADHFEHILNEVGTGALIRISIQMEDGLWLNFEVPDLKATMPWTIRFVLSIAMMMIAILVLSAWAAHYLTHPLKQLNIAANDLGRRVSAQPIPEKGPLEVRQSIRVFNKMQERIYRFVNDRTQMIAAIAHDLRTPLMRMQLRSELLEDEELRDKFNKDIDDMNHIVSTTLSFSSEEAIQKKHVPLDIVGLVSEVVHDLGEVGLSISWIAPGPNFLKGDRGSLRRAFTNVIENAAKYGEHAAVSLSIEETQLVFAIEDNGPGILVDDLEDVFKPFFRLESSRNRETGGTGLGLSIARSVFRSHGGDVTLRNRTEGGLKVAIFLPL